MEALIFIVLVLALTLPLRLLAIRLIDHADSPEYFRRHGVIVKRFEALDDIGEVVGQYHGRPIYGSLGFKGMHYEFAGVVPPDYRQRVKHCQLYLEPGLLYLSASGRRDAGAARVT
jgi:hypothetical protein